VDAVKGRVNVAAVALRQEVILVPRTHKFRVESHVGFARTFRLDFEAPGTEFNN
jgi:hypothetical protein